MATRKIPILQIAITSDNEGNEGIAALRQDGEIYIYHIGSSYEGINRWSRLPTVPDGNPSDDKTTPNVTTAPKVRWQSSF
jgi:hypothetical protein